MLRTITQHCAIGLFAIFAASASAQSTPLLLRNPSLSRDHIAFVYADDIWTVPRDGGDAQRLTSVSAVTAGPYYSPDGAQIAYSTHENGVTEVYVVSSDGGVPRRITWDPSGDEAVGWTPDGKDILFASARESYSDFVQLYRAHADGTGSPTVLPLPTAIYGNISPDGQTIAYVPVEQWEAAWKHYRGGQTTPVWLVNLKTLDLVKVPRDTNSNDGSPVWEDRTVYFLSDRNGAVSLFSYDTETKAVTDVLNNKGYDLKSVAAGPGALVYEQFGSLHLYDLASHQQHTVPVTIHGDLPSLVP
ncbi:MAG: protease, partial [Acidobacteriaceae bacterium]